MFVNGLALAGSLAFVFVLAQFARSVEHSEVAVQRTIHVGSEKRSDDPCNAHGLKYASWDLTVPPARSRAKEPKDDAGRYEGLDVGVVNR
jgi:hypothetical protein